MDALRAWEQRLRRITVEEQEKAILKIVDEFEPVALDMNTAQLLDGKDSAGQLLRPYRNPLYAEFKRTLNSKGVTDLKLTGDFHQSFFQDATKFPVAFGATDEKTDELVQSYGKEIFGLSKENTEDFADQLKPEIVNYYSSILPIR